MTNIQKIAYLVVLLLAATAGYYYALSLNSTMAEQLEEQILLTQQELGILAKTTGLAQIDDETATVLRDCSTRARYEELLQKLENLSATELVEVQGLHRACSGYFPTVRAFMAHRLKFALAEYETVVNIATNNKAGDSPKYKLAEWRALVTKEVARADLLRRQGFVQGEIIDVFVDNRKSELPELLEEAQSINGSLSVTSLQIKTEREALVGS